MYVMSNSVEYSYLLYGPPCSGKTTVATDLQRATGADYFSFGHIVRSEAQKNTEAYRLFKQYASQQRRFPEDIVVRLVEENAGDILRKGQGLIFDGFPKHAGEALSFIRLAEQYHIQLGGIFLIEAPLDVLLQRVQLRRICDDCLIQTTLVSSDEQRGCLECGGQLVMRSEDYPDKFAVKYGFYQQVLSETMDVLANFQSPVVRIDGNKPVSSVAECIVDSVYALRRLG